MIRCARPAALRLEAGRCFFSRRSAALKLEARSVCNIESGCDRRTFITGRCLVKTYLAKTLLREKCQVRKEYIFDYK